MTATRAEHLESLAVTHVNGAEPFPVASSITVTGVANEPTGDDSRTLPVPGTSGRENAKTSMLVIEPRPSIERGVAVSSSSGSSAGWHERTVTAINAQAVMRIIHMTGDDTPARPPSA